MSAIELLEPKLADAQAELANMREVFTSFEALRPLGAALPKVSDAPEATVVEPAPEAVTEEPAEMSSTIWCRIVHEHLVAQLCLCDSGCHWGEAAAQCHHGTAEPVYIFQEFVVALLSAQ